jgi:putative transposase
VARLPRLAVPGCSHLVLQRGHNGERVFADEADRRAYLAALADASVQHGLRIHGWGLADSQVLLLAEPQQADSLSRAVQAVGRRYVAAFNRRHGRCGTLWDGRFRAGIVESPRFVLAALLFAETAGGVLGAADLADDSRSSRPHHLGTQRLALVSDHSVYWSLGNTPFDREASYRRLAEQAWGSDQHAALARATEHGWVLGTPAFAGRVAEQAARPAQPRRRGRPRRLAG